MESPDLNNIIRLLSFEQIFCISQRHVPVKAAIDFYHIKHSGFTSEIQDFVLAVSFDAFTIFRAHMSLLRRETRSLRGDVFRT